MPLMNTTDLLSRVHSPVVALQSSLSSGISRVSSICLVIETTSSRAAAIIEGLGSGLTGFGLLNWICPNAASAVDKTARTNRIAGAETRSDIDLFLSNNLLEP